MSPCNKPSHDELERLHRIHDARLSEGISLQMVARRTGVDRKRLGLQEKPSSDLRISDLRMWQKALGGVPLIELLEEPDQTSSKPILERGRFIRLMKTVMALSQSRLPDGPARLVEMLREQLIEAMPELAHVVPWHSVGQRRGIDEMGRAAENPFPDDGAPRNDIGDDRG